jgi:hypothetical protein
MAEQWRYGEQYEDTNGNCPPSWGPVHPVGSRFESLDYLVVKDHHRDTEGGDYAEYDEFLWKG